MSFLETILTSFLFSGLWLVVIGFLGKSLIANLLNKDLEIHKGQIAAQNIEKQIVLARLHEKRAEAIANIYQGLIEYLKDSKSFVHKAEHVEEDEREILLENMSQSATDFRNVYQHNHLYLNKVLCEKIQSVFKEVQIPAHQFIFAFASYKHAENLSDEEYDEAWKKAFTAFADKIPPILSTLEYEFRLLLGVVES